MFEWVVGVSQCVFRLDPFLELQWTQIFVQTDSVGNSVHSCFFRPLHSLHILLLTLEFRVFPSISSISRWVPSFSCRFPSICFFSEFSCTVSEIPYIFIYSFHFQKFRLKARIVGNGQKKTLIRGFRFCLGSVTQCVTVWIQCMAMSCWQSGSVILSRGWVEDARV